MIFLAEEFFHHDKVAAAGPEASFLYLAAIGWLKEHKSTDGTFLKHVVGGLTALRSPDKLARRLVEAGLLEDTGDRYKVHNYEKHNAKSIASAAKAAKAAAVRWGSASEDCSEDCSEEGSVDAPSNAPSIPQAVPEHDGEHCLSDAPSSPLPLTKRISLDPEFDEFWRAYPKRVGKIAARKAWATARRQATAEVIIAGIEPYKRSKQFRDGFVKDPTTWLNKGCWDDEHAIDRGPDEVPGSDWWS